MRKESELFDQFNTLTKVPDDEVSLTQQIAKCLAAKPGAVSTYDLVDMCKTYRDTHHSPTTGEIDALVSGVQSASQRKEAIQVLKKIARVQVLDVSAETSLLREVKDIEDELTIMSILFEDQKTVLTTLEELICSRTAVVSELKLQEQRSANVAAGISEASATLDCGALTHNDYGHQTAEFEVLEQPGIRDVRTIPGAKETLEPKETNLGRCPRLEFWKNIKRIQDRPGALCSGGVFGQLTELERCCKESDQRTGYISQIIGNVREQTKARGTIGRSKGRTQPVVVVQLSLDEIGRMLLRARKANQAVCNVSSILSYSILTNCVARLTRGSEAEAK